MDSVSEATASIQEVLRGRRARNLEKLAAELLGSMLNVTLIPARAGSQHGGDGGVHGESGAHLVYEARRYGDGTRFRDRDVRGEISEAVDRDPDLELWLLVSTRDVPEQTVDAMAGAARQHGIDALAIDWLPARLPRLAVLCASAPGAFSAAVGGGFNGSLKEIASAPDYPSVLSSIRSSLHATGHAQLERASHRRIHEIWTDPDRAQGQFHQNVAGGHRDVSHVRRREPSLALDRWLAGSRTSSQPVFVTGREGTGKTWAVLDWLQSRVGQLPIVIAAPSSSIPKEISGRTGTIEFIARCLRDLADDSVRDQRFWERRVTRVLEQSSDQGPALVLFFDGLNERPSDRWGALFDLLQDEPFHSRVRVIASARDSFVDGRMDSLRGQAWEAMRVEVGAYGDEPGGEFDQKLRAGGLTHGDLPDGVVDLARVPRLFDMVVALRDRLGGVERVTVHRLFWEYGDSSFARTGFSSSDWRGFVLELAREFRDRAPVAPRNKVEALTGGAATTPDAVYRRVSSVIDSVFSQLTDFDEIEFELDFVCHALGLALVHKLRGSEWQDSWEALEGFFEPTNHHDNEAEIARAAVSIALAMGQADYPAPLAALCTWWVQCQNLPDSHLLELAALASEIVEPLLEAIERTEGHAASSPRYRAINALHTVDATDRATARAIAARGAEWLGRIAAAPVSNHGHDDDSAQTYHHRRLESRIGTAEYGRHPVLGREVEIVPEDDEGLGVAAAQLLQGRPLVEAIDLFEAGAVHLAITADVGEEHAWLNILNAVDPEATASALRERAASMENREPEVGVHSGLGRRVAAILLWRTGYVEDAQRASAIDPGMDRQPSYEEDYLADPATSFYTLERRHVDATLRRQDVPLGRRLERAAEFLVDPQLPIPETLTRDVVAAARQVDYAKMAAGNSWSREDWAWRGLSLALARCAPEELARIERKRLREFAEREGERRYGAALAAPDAMLLVGPTESAELRKLRERVPGEGGGSESGW